MPDKVAVIGAGAVGGYYGGALARAGLDVALICRGEHRDKIVADGLFVESNWGNYTVHPQATPDASEIGPVDLVLYAVKLYSNPEAIPLIKPLLGENTVVLPVQNGTESASIIADVYGWDRVLSGTTYIEAGRAGLGHIEQAGATARIAFGEQDGSRTPRIDKVESILSQEGVQAEVSADIRKTLWSKLVLVAAVGTLMAATRGNYVQILENPQGERTARSVMEEIVAVGESEGITFDDGLIDSNLKGSRDEAPELMASLQIDLEAGNPLEIDDLLGSVIRKGRKNGIAVPASAALYSALYNFRAGSPA
ncbi:MAG: 2-dehydropantoate 2-reductase [Chloroflexi bacterium]|nr:2-dehydropantoate 2-reductase [Chloroflexota bacterium]